MIPNRALIKQQRLASKFRRFGFFKIAPDINELAEQAMQKLLNREDLVAMQHPLVLPSGEYAVDQPGHVTTPDAWRENHGATDNPKYNYDKWYEIRLTLNYLVQHAPQLFKFFPWVVKQIKQGNILSTGQTGHALGDRRHIQDILQQAWQHMEYLRSQPPGSPNAAPIPDINQLNFDQLQQWVYDRNSTGIDVRPGFEWGYNEGYPKYPKVQPNDPQEYPHDIQQQKYDVGNGWYVWPVFTKEDLAKEGELMGHCVGGYCNNVHSGASVIFSLRDPKGEPHATIELDGSPGSYNVVQVQGKQNSEPSSEYKSMVKNFFDQLKQQGIDVTQRVRIRNVNELEEYEWMSRPDEAYGLEIDADIDEDGIARDLVGYAADGYGDESVAGTLQDLMHEGIIDYRTMESYIKDEIESRVEDKARELENDWEEQKKYLYQDFQQAREDERGDEEEDDGEFHEPEDDTQEFEEWLEENYPEQVYAERDNFEEAALDEMPQVYDLKQRFGSVRKWSYWPDQGGGDPRPDKMGPTLNTDYAPLEDTFDALGPCQKCNNPLTRDAEGVYCPSCGYRSNPQAENARIDMYAPLGEGIGEGPFGLMSKTAINWPWQKPKSPGDWMQWVGDPEKNPFDQKNVPEGWKVPPWMKGEESLGDAIQRGMANGLEMQRLLESPNPVDYAQGAALHTKSLGYYHPEDEQDQFYSTIETLMYEYGLDEKDAWHFLSQAWTEQGLSMPSGRDSFSKWTADVWWLPSKTAADVRELANQALRSLWNRDDLKKLWEQMSQFEHICSEYGIADNKEGLYLLEHIFPWIDNPEKEPPLLRANMNSRGYSDDSITQAIEHAKELKPFYQGYQDALIFEEVLTDLEARYPASYKIWPWAVKQIKTALKANNRAPTHHWNTNWQHFTDIVGQSGELITQLRQQNQLPQGFDINQLAYNEIDQWLKDYHAEHVGEGWDERNVWATLPNGWTVEEVKTENDLQREGEIMGHCVGGYCRQVQKGTSLIFSLRDPKGMPHVTFEYKPIYDMTDDYGGPYQHAPNPAKITRLELVQVQGKADSKPKPEYQQMVAEFNKYLQGEGYQVVWSDNAWRHDYGINDQQRQQLRHENTYDLRGIEGLHQLEHDYDRNKGTEFFTKQLPDMADEYGVLSPSGVPEQWLQHPQLQSATDDVLFEIFDGKIKPDQYEEYGRKLIVAWYSLLSQPYASQGRAVGPYSPKSPVDARTWLVQYIGKYGAKLVADYNQQDVNQNWPAKTDSQVVIDGMTNLTGFQRTIGDRTGTQMLDWTRPAGIDPDEQVPGTMHYWQNYELHRDQGATMGDYIPYDPIHNPEGTDTRMDEPGFHPEAAAPPEYVPYKFIVGKDGRIYGGQAYEHRPLIEGYGLDRDPGWTEVARGEYDPNGGMTLAEFANSPFGAADLASRVHQWAGTVNDPNIPVPNGDVRYNQWVQGQGWDKRQFRIAAAKWSMPMTIPQQQRAWEQTGANPEVVYQFDNGWTVRHMQTSNEVHSVGLLCRNCWQDFEADMSNGSNYYALFNQHNLPIIAFYVSGGNVGRIELPRGPRNRLIAPEEDQMLKEFAQAWNLGYHDPEKYNPTDAYLDVLRERDMTDDADLRPNIDYRECPHCGHYPLDTFGRPVTYEECPKCGWSTENVIRSSWKYAADSIPANYTESDPLDLQGKQPVFDNMQVDWWKLPPVQQRQAIVNAFRATMLSPRLNLKNNAIMYQEFMSIPADESDPDVFENHARDLKERWDRQGQGDLMNEVQPIGWEKVVPGKLIPGFWGNIRRLAALGPYADDLRQAALDDLNETGGKGTLFRNEVLKLGIPGVGPKVASFAWLALNPKGSDLATIDVWMMRHLNQDAESPNTPSHYFQLEDQLRDEKDAMYGPNTPLGQYQWGVWDKIRTPGFHQDHSPLKVHDPTPYTDVAWTQQYRAPRPQQLPEQAPGQEQLFANLKQ